MEVFTEVLVEHRRSLDEWVCQQKSTYSAVREPQGSLTTYMKSPVIWRKFDSINQIKNVQSLLLRSPVTPMNYDFAIIPRALAPNHSKEIRACYEDQFPLNVGWQTREELNSKLGDLMLLPNVDRSLLEGFRNFLEQLPDHTGNAAYQRVVYWI